MCRWRFLPEDLGVVDEEIGGAGADAADAGLVASDGDGDAFRLEGFLVCVELCADDWRTVRDLEETQGDSRTAFDADGRQSEIASIGKISMALVAWEGSVGVAGRAGGQTFCGGEDEVDHCWEGSRVAANHI